MITLNNILPKPLESLGVNPDSNIFATSITFEKGKKYFVTAPSGKGKSTFLHCIYGLREDYSGRIVLDGQPTAALTPDRWSEKRQTSLSMVFQDLRLFQSLTAMENIMLKADLTKTVGEADVRAMASLLGVDMLLDKPVATLSYGQRQRIAIIRALAQPFSFLLLDEPFSHLDDANTRIACQLIAKAVEAQKAGMILVSLGERYYFDYDQDLIL